MQNKKGGYSKLNVLLGFLYETFRRHSLRVFLKLRDFVNHTAYWEEECNKTHKILHICHSDRRLDSRSTSLVIHPDPTSFFEIFVRTFSSSFFQAQEIEKAKCSINSSVIFTYHCERRKKNSIRK